jgi:hypothetical protein
VFVGVAHGGDLGQGETQVGQSLDAHQSHEVGSAVLLVAVVVTVGFFEQADLVIVPDRSQARACEFGDLTGAPCHASIVGHGGV